MYSAEVIEKREKEYRAEDCGGRCDPEHRHRKAELDTVAHYFRHQEQKQLREEYSEADASADTYKRGIQSFRGKDARDMLFLHSENIEKSDLLFTALHEKAVCVKNEHR